ncbi:MAG TPA: oxidoreductase [Acidimicrobiales bacterium]|nr:oxidoreductase [Acidimicrobiales bacterium]
MGDDEDAGPWRTERIGDLTGTVALVTGANSGIGLETTRALLAHGAHVVMACRDEARARTAADALERDLERTSLEILAVDLADLTSVRDAARTFLSEHAQLDLLVNNAGVMGTPYRRTADGFELQMATNHFGHFALTGLLLDRLLASVRGRVVTVSSLMHRVGRVDLDDVAATRPRNRWLLYGTSKLANLLFTSELDRRVRREGATLRAVAAHPGWTRSNLAGTGAALSGGPRARVAGAFGRHLGQATATGALPVLYAATARGVEGGAFYGPGGPGELKGPPVAVSASRRARRTDDAAALWERSEALTGVRYALVAPV